MLEAVIFAGVSTLLYHLGMGFLVFLVPLQVVRGFIFVLVVFLVVSGLRLAKAKQALLIGMGLFILGGLTPLVAAEVWPVALRFYHTVEIFFQNFTAGAVLAYLLGVSPEGRAGQNPMT